MMRRISTTVLAVLWTLLAVFPVGEPFVTPPVVAAPVCEMPSAHDAKTCCCGKPVTATDCACAIQPTPATPDPEPSLPIRIAEADAVVPPTLPLVVTPIVFGETITLSPTLARPFPPRAPPLSPDAGRAPPFVA